jgi:hypothetical protein
MICGVRRKNRAALDIMVPGRCGHSRHCVAAACSPGSVQSSLPKRGPGETESAQALHRQRGIDGRRCDDYAASRTMPNKNTTKRHGARRTAARQDCSGRMMRHNPAVDKTLQKAEQPPHVVNRWLWRSTHTVKYAARRGLAIDALSSSKKGTVHSLRVLLPTRRTGKVGTMPHRAVSEPLQAGRNIVDSA